MSRYPSLFGTALANPEWWEMSPEEFGDSVFHQGHLSELLEAEHGQRVYSLGYYLKGPHVRQIFADVLDTPVVVNTRMPYTAAFTHNVGNRRGWIQVNNKDLAAQHGMGSALLHEGVHALRLLKGRDVDYPPGTTGRQAYDMPFEVSARRMQDYEERLRKIEPGHEAYVQRALKEGRHVPAEVKQHYGFANPARHVGKVTRDSTYVHRNYVRELPPALGALVERAKPHVPSDFPYTVVKVNRRNGNVSFIQSPDFDTTNEPIQGLGIVVSREGRVGRVVQPADPFVYHRKELLVGEDYRGFDVEASKRRSRWWTSFPDIDYTRIGKRRYWHEWLARHGGAP